MTIDRTHSFITCRQGRFAKQLWYQEPAPLTSDLWTCPYFHGCRGQLYQPLWQNIMIATCAMITSPTHYNIHNDYMNNYANYSQGEVTRVLQVHPLANTCSMKEHLAWNGWHGDSCAAPAMGCGHPQRQYRPNRKVVVSTVKFSTAVLS